MPMVWSLLVNMVILILIVTINIRLRNYSLPWKLDNYNDYGPRTITHS